MPREEVTRRERRCAESRCERCFGLVEACTDPSYMYEAQSQSRRMG